MSDATLLAAGCAVSFIAAAGMYVYLREAFTRSQQVRQRGELRDEVEAALRVTRRPRAVEAVPVERRAVRVREPKRDQVISA